MSRLDPAGFRARYGPWALIAGGSLGLGAAYADELAARGLSLLVIAEEEASLEGTCRRLRERHGIEARPLPLDLGDPDLLERLRPHTDGLEIGCVVYNAATSFVGNFLDQDPGRAAAALDVNCRGPLLLAHEYGGAMARRGRGGIVLMSSVSALTGTPLVAVYSATKAFDLALAESLWEELGRHGVDVVAPLGGVIRTPNWEHTAARAGGVPVMEPAAVAREAIDALGSHPRRVIGWRNRLAAFALSRLPRGSLLRFMGRTMRAQYPDQAGGRGSETGRVERLRDG